MTVNTNGIAKVHNADGAQDFLHQLGRVGQVQSVFSEPLEAHGYTIIQAAEVALVGGAGYGSGEASSESNPDEKSHGSGGGGGGYSFARPVASIVISSEGVRVEPIIDPTKIALTFFSALAAIVVALARIRRLAI